MTVTATCVEHVLRLRSLLPSPPRRQSPSASAERAPLACGICWPYNCSCAADAQARVKSSSPPRRHSFLQPINLARLKREGHWEAASAASSAPHTASNGARHKASSAASASSAAQGRRSGSDSTAPSTAPEKLALSPLPSGTAPTSSSASNPASSASASTPAPCFLCAQPLPSSGRTTVASNASNACRGCKVYSSSDLASHTTEGDLWLSIRGRVYDLSSFAATHPGGLLPLLDTAGCDASDVFRVFHPRGVDARLPGLQVGLMGAFDPSTGILLPSAWEETPLQKDFHSMIRQMESEGQFRTDMGWYGLKVMALAAIFALALGLLYLSHGAGGYWALIGSALALGMFWQQIAFLGHDLGHNSVRGSVDKDWLAGLVVTALFGVSVQWWKRSHNVHHVVTNALEHDPDIQHLPVFTVSTKAFKGFYSSYFQKHFAFDTACRWLVAHQHVLYYPVMGVARFNLYAQSLILVADTSKPVRHRAYEVAALAVFWTWLVALACLTPSWPACALFVLLSHQMAGLVHVQITLSHFGQPVYEGRGYSAASEDVAREHFLRSQFETSMDIECHPALDWLHGGLQFQLTHHLLPRVPRHRLRHVREHYVKPFAAKHGLVYKSDNFFDANVQVYHVLRDAAIASRNLPQANLKESFLWQFLNAEG